MQQRQGQDDPGNDDDDLPVAVAHARMNRDRQPYEHTHSCPFLHPERPSGTRLPSPPVVIECSTNSQHHYGCYFWTPIDHRRTALVTDDWWLQDCVRRGGMLRQFTRPIIASPRIPFSTIRAASMSSAKTPSSQLDLGGEHDLSDKKSLRKKMGNLLSSLSNEVVECQCPSRLLSL